MSKSAHTEAQMIGAVKQVEAGRKAEEVAREMSVSKHTDVNPFFGPKLDTISDEERGNGCPSRS